MLDDSLNSPYSPQGSQGPGDLPARPTGAAEIFPRSALGAPPAPTGAAEVFTPNAPAASPGAPGKPPAAPARYAPVAATPFSSGGRTGALLQAILSALAVLSIWAWLLLAGIVVLTGVAMRTIRFSEIPSSAGAMGGLLVLSLLLLPSVYYPAMRLAGRPAYPLLPLLRRARVPAWLLAFPVLLGVGYLVSLTPLAFLLMPILHPAAAIIPSAWIAYWGLRGLPLGSEQRAWGVFAAGLALGPLFMWVLEIGVLLLFIAAFTVYLISRPDLTNELMLRLGPLRANPEDMSLVIETLRPYLTHPKVIFSVMAYVAVIVPLIEEALKPIGVWLLARRNITPQAGLAIGVLSGLAYATMETMLQSVSGAPWVGSMAARVGTSAIHIFNTGVMGYAIVQAVRRRRYVQLGLIYAGAVLLHGLWNGATVMLAFTQVSSIGELQDAAQVLTAPVLLLMLALVILAGLAFAGLVAVNRRVRRQAPGSPDAPAPGAQIA